LKRRLPALESEKIAAEDALDEVDMKLRKHRRRMAGSWAQRSAKGPSKDVEVDAYFESELESEKQRLEDEIRHLESALREAEQELVTAVSEVPLAFEIANEAEEKHLSTEHGDVQLSVNQLMRTQEITVDVDEALLDTVVR